MCLCRCECERGIKVHTRVTPERTSSKEIRLCPSLRSSYRSVMCFLTWEREWQAKKEGRRKGEGRGMEREKHRERKKKLIPHSNHPSVDSTLLTSAIPIAPQLTGLLTAVARPTGTEHQLWPLVSVAMTSPSQWLGWGWVVTAGDRCWNCDSAAWSATELFFVRKWDTQWHRQRMLQRNSVHHIVVSPSLCESKDFSLKCITAWYWLKVVVVFCLWDLIFN